MKVLSSIIFSVAFLTTAIFSATLDLKGKVVDEKGEALSQVKVELLQKKLVTQTNSAGEFHFTESTNLFLDDLGHSQMRFADNGIYWNNLNSSNGQLIVFYIKNILGENQQVKYQGKNENYFIPASQIVKQQKPGQYFLTIYSGERRIHARILKLSETDVRLQSELSVVISSRKAAGSLVVVDSVKASIEGYETRVKMVESYDGTLPNIVLRKEGVAPVVSEISISGVFKIAETLKGAYKYSDKDGDLEGNTQYQWYRAGVAIAGASDTLYTLSSEDVGKTLTFGVTPWAKTGVPDVGKELKSTQTDTIAGWATPIAENVTITGNAIPGQTLTGSYDYSDEENDLENGSIFQWYLNGTKISGATQIDYTVRPGDVGKDIQFAVTPTSIGSENPIGLEYSSNKVEAFLGIVDVRDNEVYHVQSMGNLVWMTDNLNYDTKTDESMCYGNDPAYCEKYGRLYKWIAVMGLDNSYFTTLWTGDEEAHQGICPQGWRVPSAADWDSLASYISREKSYATWDGEKWPGVAFSLKADTGWFEETTGTDEFNFNATASGHRDPFMGYDYAGVFGYWWTSTQTATNQAKHQVMFYGENDLYPRENYKASAYALRCVATATAPVASNLSISGTPKQGQILTATYTFSDVEGDAESGSLFRWFRDGVEIVGATESTYAIQYADSGAKISFEVTPVAGSALALIGQPETSSETIAVTGWQVPTVSNLSIVGTPRQDSVLTVSYTFNDSDGDLEGASEIQWYREGVAIVGATDSSYSIVYADSGKTLSFGVVPVSATGENVRGVEVKSAGSVKVTGFNFPIASNLVFAGSMKEDSIVYVSSWTYQDTENDARAQTQFQWYRDNVAISGATDSTYKVVYADSGRILSVGLKPVAQTGTNLVGQELKVSAAEKVIGFNPPALTDVYISGVATVGSQIRGEYTFSDPDGDSEGASTYKWYRAGSLISGATNRSYTVQNEDFNKVITFEVIPVSATGLKATGATKAVTTLGLYENRVVSEGLTDSRDNQKYDVVYAGTRVWIAENLAWLPQVNNPETGSEDSGEENQSYYYVSGYYPTGADGATQIANAKATQNYQDYGVLYNWNAATSACPSGWHMATHADWEDLARYAGLVAGDTSFVNTSWTAVGVVLKSTNLWIRNGENDGTNDIHFGALPGGFRLNGVGYGSWTPEATYRSYMWSQANPNDNVIYSRFMRDIDAEMDLRPVLAASDQINKSWGMSLRCVQD